MKPFVLAFLLSGFIYNASAQVKKPVQTVKISTPTVVAEECKTRIETYLKRYDGILSINVNWRKKETTVKFVTDRTNIEVIKTAISNAGFDADDVKANEDAYKKLPRTCKKPEDGGPKPKGGG